MPKYHCMKLTKPIPVLQDDAPKFIWIRFTTEHPASHYGQAISVDKDGNAWDQLSLASYVATGGTRYFRD